MASEGSSGAAGKGKRQQRGGPGRMTMQAAGSSMRGSIWWRPAVYSLLAVALVVAVAFVPLPRAILFALPVPDQDTLDRLLSTVTSSALTITTVTLSVLMLVLNMAGSQGSPRALPELMADKAVQNAVAVFIAVFVFGLAALLTSGLVELAPLRRSLMGALGAVAALLLLRWLVALIAHATDLVKLGRLIDRLHGQARDTLDTFLDIEPQAKRAADDQLRPLRQVRDVEAQTPGHFVACDVDALCECAREHGLVVEVPLLPGEYTGRYRPLLRVEGLPHDSDERQKIIRRLCAAILVMKERDGDRDPLLGLELLVEIGVRALSPGINDPVTAVMCVERVADLVTPLVQIAPKDWPANAYEGGMVRVRRPQPGFMVDRGFSALARHGGDNLAVIEPILRILRRVREKAHPAYRSEIDTVYGNCVQYARDALPTDRDKQMIGELLRHAA